MYSTTLAALLVALCSLLSAQDRTIRLPLDAKIAPDGRHVVFAWRDDVWSADIDAGTPARRLTWNPARDRHPMVSPDGQRILFTSDRSGQEQVWVMAIDGGAPRQVTFDSESKRPLEWMADGGGFLAIRTSDRSPFPTEARRLVAIRIERDRPEQILFDGGAEDGTLSPDGHRVLFTRGRIEPTRKGYRGSAATQLWLADLAAKDGPKLDRLAEDREHYQNVSERDPMWAPDGKGYFFVSDPEGTFDVFYRAFDGGPARRVTDLGQDGSDDGVLFPSLSADGARMLFLRRFDLRLLDTTNGEVRTVSLTASGDELASNIERIRQTRARTVAFTDDGKQIAIVAGEDLFVMDRVLREPVQVTATANVESDPVFADGGKRLLFVSDAGGEVDIQEATSDREDGAWWRSGSFALRKVTDDHAVESGLKPSPDGAHVAFVKGEDLWVMDADGTDPRRILESWNAPRFDWSPDGRWLCYSVEDSNFNSDVFVVPLDGSKEPFNISRHPNDDVGPAWSPDGERIAWVGRRNGDEVDVYWVNLRKQKDEETDRDRKLKEAIEAMSGDKPKKGEPKAKKKPANGAKPDEQEPEGAPEKGKDQDAEKAGAPKPVEIDFDGLHERIQQIRVPDSREGNLLWSPDGKQLTFSASIDGDRGMYAVTFPDEMKPKKLSSKLLRDARWLKAGDQIVGLDGGEPASMKPKGGKVETFPFTVLEARDWSQVRQLAFDEGWRAMRDSFYDGSLNGRDWDAVRTKYRDVAGELLGAAEFSLMMNMMLGELNSSHMGHRGGREPLPRPDRGSTWAPRTFQLGLRFDRAAGGPGLLVESVIPKSPCAESRSLVRAGERLLAIDGEDIGTDTDLYARMTMPQARDMTLRVQGREGEVREVVVRPVPSVSRLLYDEWVEGERKRVEELSGGRLGYLHIRGMNDSSFEQLEADLYAAGAGKDGLVIDVRFNGGGSTADHVLTVLTQPRHAITVPRGGSPGYPQDRKVYASWWRPIVLMCNEMSFSNAEILSHAIQTLGRGQVVGMRTAGGVISTGARLLVDGSLLRMPFRGWFLLGDGQDMELNGCLPDHALWNRPDGPDDQLTKAVEVLKAECDAMPPDPKPIPRSQR